MESFITAFESLSFQFISFTVGVLTISFFVLGFIIGKKS